LKTKSIIFSTLLIAASFGIFISGCNSDKKTANSAVDTSDSAALFITGNETDPSLKDRKFEQVPAIGTSADGKQIFVAWYSGGAAPGPGNYVTLSVSQDAGENWLNDQLVIYPNLPEYRFFDPAFWRDKNGNLNLFYGSVKDSLLWDGFGGVNAVEIAWNGSKITHTQPKRISDGVMSNKPIYLASKDLALFPVYVDKPLPGDSTGKVFPANGAFIRALDYSKSSDLAALSNYSSIIIAEDIRIHDEPQVVEISDKGNLMAMVRTTKGIYFSTSSDYGLNWNPVEPFTAAGATTSSRFYLGKLASGNLLMISNSSTTRNNMTAFISTDGGKTWPHKLLLDARENVSYPDADQTPDGKIHVVFDRERTSAKDILYCRFTEDDVIKGNTELVFKSKVNK
jgi:hypothetical protein